MNLEELDQSASLLLKKSKMKIKLLKMEKPFYYDIPCATLFINEDIRLHTNDILQFLSYEFYDNLLKNGCSSFEEEKCLSAFKCNKKTKYEDMVKGIAFYLFNNLGCGLIRFEDKEVIKWYNCFQTKYEKEKYIS